MILFDEVLFDPVISTTALYSSRFANSQIKNPATDVHSTAVLSPDPHERLTLELDKLTPEQIEYVLNFWNAGYGNAIGFRVSCFADCKATREGFGTGDGNRTAFPLYKTYQRKGSPRAETRRILKPVASGLVSSDGITPRTNTCRVYQDNAEVLTTVNSFTGVVTFSTAPPLGAVLQWSGEYDLPCAFVDAELQITSVDVTSEVKTLQLRRINAAELGLPQ